MVLATREHIGRRVDQQKIDGSVALGGPSRNTKVVFQVGVAHVPTVHWASQVGAVGVPIENVESIWLASFKIVSYHIWPDGVVSSQGGKDEGKLPSRHNATTPYGLFACHYTALVDQ